MNDYHRYVRAGKFEEMWKECDDPWNEKGECYEASPCSIATKYLIRAQDQVTTCSLGSGLGRHLDWLNVSGCGVELSETAYRTAAFLYPWLTFEHANIVNFMRTNTMAFPNFLFREILWYILPDWAEVVDILKTKHQGALAIVELSFYDNQKYGLDYFNGPDDFIAKWPFTIEKIVREHTTKQQREGRLMIAGRVP